LKNVLHRIVPFFHACHGIKPAGLSEDDTAQMGVALSDERKGSISVMEAVEQTESSAARARRASGQSAAATLVPPRFDLG
jgi:hypothetical protein